IKIGSRVREGQFRPIYFVHCQNVIVSKKCDERHTICDVYFTIRKQLTLTQQKLSDKGTPFARNKQKHSPINHPIKNI
ncbi:hypothetical protein, partial [Bacteroides heparinolyticus]|uniref:hypothetical protein n=1 Tax=Prevotella heparinolytica TaxID=28113 RepID=UPI0035A05EBF